MISFFAPLRRYKEVTLVDAKGNPVDLTPTTLDIKDPAAVAAALWDQGTDID